MSLECLHGIITDNLAIQIDLTDLKSWNLNTGLTSFSLTKWSSAVSDNINLIDFGLTAFDNGRTNIMWSGITLTPKDTLFSMYRVGYNVVQNPTTGETSGVTVTTVYLPMSATSATGGSLNYFDLNGGYLQGFFKLDGFNYELLPARYNLGITLETIAYLYPNSQGIFLMMGARAEDKYNPYFSGETITGATTTGVVTSFDNFLDSFTEKQVVKNSFSLPENMTETVFIQTPQADNIKNNVIAFELTADKHLAYKYINADGLIVTNMSPAIVTSTGFTLITIVFTPNEKIDDPDLLMCTPLRTGKLIFYINGRSIWTIKEFPEFYFKSFNNDKEKQESASYSISWGGGSFGLKNSWHYDYQTYILYNGQDTAYINNNFVVESNPLPTGGTQINGLSLSADSSTFDFTVMKIKYTGGTGNTYFIKFNQPISILSNRDYTANTTIFNDNFFNSNVNNKISILMFSDTVDIDIISDTEFVYPITAEYLQSLSNQNLHPFPDKEEYEWFYNDVMYYGDTGVPVTQSNILYGYSRPSQTEESYVMTGSESWLPIRSKFRAKDNTGQNFIYMGLLIETSGALNTGGTLYIKDFTYSAADILVQDHRKDDLLIEQNFDSGFIGGIQKLRIYDKAFTSTEVLHNASKEAEKNANIVVSKGGRIIYR